MGVGHPAWCAVCFRTLYGAFSRSAQGVRKTTQKFCFYRRSSIVSSFFLRFSYGTTTSRYFFKIPRAEAFLALVLS